MVVCRWRFFHYQRSNYHHTPAARPTLARLEGGGQPTADGGCSALHPAPLLPRVLQPRPAATPACYHMTGVSPVAHSRSAAVRSATAHLPNGPSQQWVAGKPHPDGSRAGAGVGRRHVRGRLAGSIDGGRCRGGAAVAGRTVSARHTASVKTRQALGVGATREALGGGA